MYIATRENAIVNRLNRTKKVLEVDHEADLVARLKEEGRVKRLQATERVSPTVPRSSQAIF